MYVCMKCLKCNNTTILRISVHMLHMFNVGCLLNNGVTMA